MTSVGIDLGTTYSLVALGEPSGPRLVATAAGERSTPSVVMVREDGSTLVGEEAKRSAAVHADRTFDFFKRRMGQDWTYTVDGRDWSPAELSADVLRSLLDDVWRVAGDRPAGAVITVPAYFGEAPRTATLDAARRAGVQVHELIHEPTAAALAFGCGGHDHDGETILVYDLGGGTFDVSVVAIEDGVMRVVATDGDHELGGKDFDDELMGLVARAFADRHGDDPLLDPVAATLLRERVEDAKRALSRMPRTVVPVALDAVVDRVEVTREAFEDATRSLLTRTEQLLADVLAEARLGWDDLSGTLLVGGSTRMPMCAELVERVTGRRPKRGLDPDLAVVTGAAMLAATHDPDQRQPGSSRAAHGISRAPQIADVTAHALGLVVINAGGDRYVNDVMIPRNASIPARAEQVKRLDAGSDAFDVYLLQGHQERPIATESLGRYRFTGVPASRKPVDVLVAYGYDANGIVDISASVGGVSLGRPEHNAADTDLSWTEEDPRDHARRSSIAVVLLIDCSGSMAGGKLAEAKRSCVAFAGLVGELEGAHLGLVSFASGAREEAALGGEPKVVVAAAESLSTWGSTDLTAGLERAGRMLAATDIGRRVVVVLTDGMPDDAASALSRRDALVADDVAIVAVGVTGADASFIARLASADADAVLTDEAGLAGTFRSIARSLAGGLARRT